MRQLFILFVVIFASCVSLRAQENERLEAFGGLSILLTHAGPWPNDILGGHVSVAGHVRPHIQLVGDFSAQGKGEHWENDASGIRFCIMPCPPRAHLVPEQRIRTLVFGPRLKATFHQKNSVFVHGMLGVMHQTSNTSSDTGLAIALGGGLDQQLFGPVWGRVQFDWLPGWIQGDVQKRNARASIGLVFKFGF